MLSGQNQRSKNALSAASRIKYTFREIHQGSRFVPDKPGAVSSGSFYIFGYAR
jgi:hypothetical protein